MLLWRWQPALFTKHPSTVSPPPPPPPPGPKIADTPLLTSECPAPPNAADAALHGPPRKQEAVAITDLQLPQVRGVRDQTFGPVRAQKKKKKFCKKTKFCNARFERRPKLSYPNQKHSNTVKNFPWTLESKDAYPFNMGFQAKPLGNIFTMNLPTSRPEPNLALLNLYYSTASCPV